MDFTLNAWTSRIVTPEDPGNVAKHPRNQLGTIKADLVLRLETFNSTLGATQAAYGFHMKTGFSLPILLPLFLGLSCTNSIRAQVFRLLSQQVGLSLNALIVSGDTLYGTDHGAPGYLRAKGAVYKIKTDGTGFAFLHSFTGPDGANPAAGLLLLGNTLFGTTTTGGSSSNGTVFKVNVDGTGFTVLHSFTSIDGAFPASALVYSDSDGMLYGAARQGGTSGFGTIFALGTDGTAFTNLYSFSFPNGRAPKDLTLSGTTLYGTFEVPNGAVFAIKTDGTGFTNLHYFSYDEGQQLGGPLLLSGKTLYGTTSGSGGPSNYGIVFAIGADGTGYRRLHTFTGVGDGAQPSGALVLWNDMLYGTTLRGTNNVNEGTVFAVDTSGTSFTTLHMFNPYANEGVEPTGGLILSEDKLYGATYAAIFSIKLAGPQLAINSFEGNLILGWPIHPSGFTLQFSTNLADPVWRTLSTPPAVLNDENIVVSPITGPQQFYRLVSP